VRAAAAIAAGLLIGYLYAGDALSLLAAVLLLLLLLVAWTR
jgi:hypothetical protein